MSTIYLNIHSDMSVTRTRCLYRFVTIVLHAVCNIKILHTKTLRVSKPLLEQKTFQVLSPCPEMKMLTGCDLETRLASLANQHARSVG